MSGLQWGGSTDAEPYTRHQRSHSGSRHSTQASRQYGTSSRQGAPNAAQRFPDDESVYGDGRRGPIDDDLLSPLVGPTRRPRPRIDSLSSMGSSVAPAALPQHRSRRHSSLQRPVSRERSVATPSIQLASYDSMRSGLSNAHDLPEPTSSSIGEGGLEAWLHSQAVVHASPSFVESRTNGSTSAEASVAAFRSFAPSGRVRRVDSRGDLRDGGMSDAGRSVGARSMGTGSRRTIDKRRSGLPEWEASAADDDAAGVVGPSRRAGKSVTRDWLDVDLQIASERQRTRRELGPGTMSAGGVRLREGVRRLNRSGGTEEGGAGDVLTARDREASIDALLSSARDPLASNSLAQPRGTLSASPSIGIASSLLTPAVDATRTTAHDAVRAADKEAALGSPMRTWAKTMLMERHSSLSDASRSETAADATSMGATVASAVLLSVLVKWVVGLGNWSGRGVSPLRGDFEAQRHWIEMTSHLPPTRWYFYDLPYWGLDYPPLTAHISRWCGKAASFLPGIAAHLELEKSRGSEARELVIFMRATVLAFDLLIYTPAVLFFLSRKLQGRGRRTRIVAMLTVLMQPSIILVDHGHFQYNTVMLGLAAMAFALLYTSLPNPETASRNSGGGMNALPTSAARDRTKSLSRRVSYEYIAAAIFFSLSLCFKQMALYYAPAVFAIMLGRCAGLARVRFERGLICFFGIALATSATFAIVFRHWLTDLTQLGQVFLRIFPMARGLFEDKVSNVWCFMSVLPLPAKYKLKNALSISALARLSTATTSLAILLPCVHLFAAAAETVHIEMFLDEDSKRQLLASEKRQAEGSVSGTIVSGSVMGGSSVTGRKPKHLLQVAPAPSEVGSDLASILNGGAGAGGGGRSNVSGVPGSASGRSTRQSLPASVSAPPATRAVASSSPSPAASVLAYAMLSTSLAFFLFGFQTHEKSILLPLLPMTLLISVKADEWGGGAGRTDWEWAVLMNNVGLFSMWPLLKRDGIALQYVLLSVAWNWVIGFRPLQGLVTHRKNFVAWLSVCTHVGMLSLHAIELLLPLLPSVATSVLKRYPDLFAVLNVLFTTPILATIWLWSIKRQLEVGFACGIDVLGLQGGGSKKKKTRAAPSAQLERKKQ